jgi:predicted O-methyltransferase YrrM
MDRIKIIADEVKKINLTKLSKSIRFNPKEPTFHELILDKNSVGHYRLLAYLSTKFNNELLIDIGTHMGASALALSYNRNNKIITYDLPDAPSMYYGGIEANVKLEEVNVEYKLCNVMESKERKSLLNAPLIFLDVAHRGDFENEVYDYLKKNSYKGLLILDDIHLNHAMKNFWQKIDTTKIDVTHIAHSAGGSGTGIVDFENSVELLD